MARQRARAAFLLSGIAAISYELVWVRQIGQIVGSSTVAIATTVGVFFFGLALGSWLGGRAFDRCKRPLAAYASLELAIGIVAFFVPWLLAAIERWVASNASLTAPLAIAPTSLALLLPTTLLGATFPAMARIASQLGDPIAATASFYGLNTLGGVIGCLTSAFLLLPVWGQRQTNSALVLANLLAAALIFSLARARSIANAPSSCEAEAAAEVRSDSGDDTSGNPCGMARFPAWLAALLALISGVAAIGVEVLWTRALALTFPGSVYVFAVVLAAYLLGIAFGSLLLAVLSKRTNPPRLLAALYATVGLGVVASLPAFPAIAAFFYDLVGNGRIDSWQGYIVAIGLLTLLVMLPATLAMGAALPLLIGLASARGGVFDRGRIAGRLYGLNVVGGVIGSVGATFVLMPWLGLEAALGILAAAYLALAFAALAFGHPTTSGRQRVLRAAVALIAAGVLGLSLAGALPVVAPERAAHRGQIYAEDGPSASIVVSQRATIWGVPVRSIKVNNFYGLNITAPSTIAMQYRLGHLPLILHGSAQKALLIGFATGNTLAAMAEHGLARLDCVELHGRLYRLASFFDAVNHRSYRHPGVTLYVADGRHFVRRSGPHYDVIVGDLYLPRNPGVGALYSLEHFSAVRRRLAKGGLFVAWLPLWQLSPWEVGVICRTFLRVFPHASAWLGNARRDRPVLGLIGRRTPPKQPRDAPACRAARARMSRHVLRSMRRTYGQRRELIGLLGDARFVLTEKQLRRWANRKPLNTLDQAVIEYSAPRTLTRYQLHEQTPASDNLKQIRALSPRPTLE